MMLKKKGYVTVVILSVMGFSLFLLDRIVNTSILQAHYSKDFYNQTQAKHLAFGAALMTTSLISSFESGVMPKDEDVASDDLQKKDAQKITPSDRLKTLYYNLLPILGKWQNVTFNKDEHGFDAQVSFCITCEDGKLQLNKIFDFAQYKLKKPFDDLLSQNKLKNIKDEDGDFEKIIKKNVDEKNPKMFDDVSFLKLSSKIEYFYHPESKKEAKKETVQDLSKKEKEFYIYPSDLFSVHTKNLQINPLLFSHSVLVSMGIDPDKKLSGKKLQKFIKGLTKTWSFNWKATWPSMQENLKKMYGLIPFELEEKDAAQKTSKKDENVQQDAAQNDKKKDQEKAQSGNEKKEKPSADKILKSLEPFYSLEIEPKLFSILIIVRMEKVRKKLLLMISKKSINEFYNKKEPIAQQNASLEKNATPPVVENLQTDEKSEEKSVILDSQCFFLPKKFELLRMIWL